MDCIAIIPARYASTRFPGKPLAPLAGRPLIQHVVDGVSDVRGIEATIVATDDERIAEAARESGADVVLSAGEFASGTDRVADAASQYSADVIVNVQGDELLLDAGAVAAALDRFRDSGAGLGTLRAPLTDRRDLEDPNAVKVVIDDNERALYFSRAALRGAWLHLGVYFYRAEALRRWAALPASSLEQAEGLEQLRVLEAGDSMHTYLIKEAMPGVNTPDDLERAHAALAERASHVQHS